MTTRPAHPRAATTLLALAASLAALVTALIVMASPTLADDADDPDDGADAVDGDAADSGPEPTLTVSVDLVEIPGSTWLPRGPVTTSIHGRAVERTSDAAEVDAEAAADAERSLADLGAERTPDGLVLTLPETILFDFDSADLLADADETIDRVGELLAFYTDVDVEVRGHTDSRGEDAYNQQLSEQRATVVREALVAAGAPSGRLTAEGFAASDPVAPNERPDGSDDPDGRQQNRRVEIVLREH